MSIDFKINFLKQSDNTVDITSTQKTRMTGGIFALSQKIIHGLFTNVGDDIYNESWGGNLKPIFKIPVLPTNKNKVFTKVRESIKKVESDIISDQALLTDPSAESTLDAANLIDVFPDVDNRIWRIDMEVINKTGTRFAVSLP